MELCRKDLTYGKKVEDRICMLPALSEVPLPAPYIPLRDFLLHVFLRWHVEEAGEEGDAP